MSDELRVDAFRPGVALVDTQPRPLAFADEEVAETRRQTTLAWPGAPDPNNPAHPEVGWGIVLPDRDDLTDEQRRRPDDAPAAIRRLFGARPGAKVLRYSGDPTCLRDGSDTRLLVGSPRGNGADRLPMYLLLVGGPDALPWALQYQGNLSGLFVGRLDLDDAALARYVDALLAPPAPRVDHKSTLVWTVTHDDDPDDITHLMKPAIALPVYHELKNDADTGPGALLLEGGEAKADKLVDAFVAERPTLVVTSSHGFTDELGNPDVARARLGSPVDVEEKVIDPVSAAGAATAAGTIWYAHGCCSGGSDSASTFATLLSDGPVRAMLEGVAALGAHSSPMARALLGAARPARAFIGHVELTFNWTLADGQQMLADHVRLSLVNDLYGGVPVGRALSRWYTGVAGLLMQSRAKLREWLPGSPTSKEIAKAATVAKLTALDRSSFVLHGDPAAKML